MSLERACEILNTNHHRGYSCWAKSLYGFEGVQAGGIVIPPNEAEGLGEAYTYYPEHMINEFITAYANESMSVNDFSNLLNTHFGSAASFYPWVREIKRRAGYREFKRGTWQCMFEPTRIKSHQEQLVDLFKAMGEPLTIVGDKAIFHSHTLTFDERGNFLSGVHKKRE